MRNNTLRKGLILGIICVFIGINAIPGISVVLQDTAEKTTSTIEFTGGAWPLLQPSDPTLVSCWHMDELSWTGALDEVVDSSGNGHHGIGRNGATTTSQAIHGRAGNFDGVNDYVSISSSSNIISGTMDFTVMGWLYRRDTNIANLFAYTPTNPFDNVQFVVSGTDITIWGVNSLVLTFPHGIGLNQWHHFAFTRNGNTWRAYVDGSQVGSDVTDSRSLQYPTSTYNIGTIGAATTQFFNGVADEVHVYSRGLSSAEIQDNYTSYAPVHNLNTDEYFTTIQSAIYDSDTVSGHTIYVTSGTYYEHVVINKAINLIGEDRDNTIIDGGGSGNVIYSGYDDLTIKEFTLQNGGNSAGHSNNCCIELYSDNNIICDNNIKNSYNGIHLFTSRYSTIRNNTVQSCYNGIHLESSKNNIINNNDVFDNELGFYVNDLSDSNIFSENTIFQNSNLGIYVYESNHNEFYHNNFIDNVKHVKDYHSSNSWDNGYPSGGNYWDNYTGYDIYNGPNQDIPGSDGIGDTPYDIPGGSNQDSYPFMNQNGWELPVADADGPYTCKLGDTITFSGSGSYDPDGTIVSYEWNFGDGNIGSGISPTHMYSNYGTFSVALTVTDNEGLTDTDVTTANVYKLNPPYITLLYPVGNEELKGTITLKWFALDAEDGYNLPIYLYFKDDTSSTWSAFKDTPYSNTGECAWDTTALPDGTYQLLIQAVDHDGKIGSDSSDWFQIKNHEEPPVNNAPLKPNQPSGETNGEIHQEYAYTTSTTDPDGDQVYYFWDWGDGNNSGWMGPYNSGSLCEAKHTWSVKNTYSIKVKAKDIYGKESVWSDPLPVTMPYSIKNPLQQFLELFFYHFPNAFPFLRQLMGY